MTVDLARKWLQEDPDPETRAELQALLDRNDSAELRERFAGRLEFGTAGLRGLLGAGPMRMNRLVVRQTSAGLADYLVREVPGARERGVVVGYDGRILSREFAEDTARVLAGAGFRVHLADAVVATPVCAFAVLHHGAAAGVMVTASHNPPEYNGYKVYWENGAQIIPPHDTGIAAAIASVGDVRERPMAELDSKSIITLGEDTVAAYFAGVRRLRARPELRDELSIAYTPLHGVGARFASVCFEQSGLGTLRIEASQRDPDGRFPTVNFPNPEEDGAMDRVLALASEHKADLVIANDPDADRLAVALPVEGGGYDMLTGDQIGILLADYLLEAGIGGPDALVATTVVSSQLLSKMAEARGAAFEMTLTGFKWIANAAIRLKSDGKRFVLGYEEALGYSVGELVRDKDGVSAALLFAEMTAYDKGRGASVWERLEAIYRRHGVFSTLQHSLVRPGSEGATKIREAMAACRKNPPTEIGGFAVTRFVDIENGALGLPPSDVVIAYLEGDRRVILRPSGTEPKLKCYYEVCEPVTDGEPVAAARERGEKALLALRDAHQALL